MEVLDIAPDTGAKGGGGGSGGGGGAATSSPSQSEGKSRASDKTRWDTFLNTGENIIFTAETYKRKGLFSKKRQVGRGSQQYQSQRT